MNTFLFLGDNNYRMEYHGILMQVLPSPNRGLVNGHRPNIRRVDYLMVDYKFCHLRWKDCYINN